MAKQRYQVKRKAGAIPKGLPLKKARLEGGTTYVNPFENSRASTSKSPKFLVHNRSISSHQLKQQNNTVKSALARALESRQEGLKEALYQENKAGSFMDRRIGEGRHGGSQNKGSMTQEERMLARVVRERVSRSKRSTRYNLEDDDNLLTHKGKTLMDSRNGQLSNMASDHVLLSSDDELGYDGQLDKVDTEMHFGGGTFDSKRRAQMNPYGPSDGADRNLGEVYRSRKQDLDDLIAMRKREKLLKSQRKEQQGKIMNIPI
jgi:nucleolar protein 14